MAEERPSPSPTLALSTAVEEDFVSPLTSLRGALEILRDYPDLAEVERSQFVSLALEGCEVKSLHAGNAQLTEAYVHLKNGEAWLVGAHFAPLKTVSTHIKASPARERKLLLHRHELDRLTGAVERKGYALVPLDLHFRGDFLCRLAKRQGLPLRQTVG